MKQGILLLLIIFQISLITAQNLIPNGSFEDYKSCNLNVQEAVKDAAPWYVAGGTPDAYQFNCNNPSLYESPVHRPYEGDVFIAIGGVPWKGGHLFGEGIAVEFTSPLEAGKNYLLELQVKGFRFNGTNQSPRNQCKTSPRRQFNIYLAQDSFKINHQFLNNELLHSSCNGELIYADSSELIMPSYKGINNNLYTEESEEVEWQKVTVCINAKGGERFIGITFRLGEYSLPNDCQGVADVFAGHYLNLDDISLVEFPDETIYQTIAICRDELNEIRLKDLVDTKFENAEFRWEDGTITDTRTISNGTNEHIEILWNCQIVPFYLTLVEEDCKTYINMPTAFSPNNYDGINDEIKPFINNYWEITNYEYQIYNRWGQLLFKTTDYEKAWNGLVNGKMSNQGVYVWQVKYEQNEDGQLKSYVKSGDFTLMK